MPKMSAARSSSAKDQAKKQELPPTRQVVRHRVRSMLQSMILNGDKRPGSKLVQLQLAKQLGVAQGVVREALLELQACGLVESIDNRGVYVTEINTDKLIESFEVREMHEGLAARLCCERITRADLRQLQELADKAYEMAQRGKIQEMAALDRDLHARIVHLCGNGMLIRLADNYRVFGKIVRVNRDAVVVHDEHVTILKAIEQGDGDQAEALMRQHIRAARQALHEHIAQKRFDLSWLL
ncbi:MAG: GntR family transcriptional regulator [Vicinamibacteraceae bacterium]